MRSDKIDGGAKVFISFVCNVSFIAREMSPTDRSLERKRADCTAQIVLGAESAVCIHDNEDLCVSRSGLDSRPMERAEILEWYANRSDLAGRYRVLDELYGTSQETILGRITYREIDDFADSTGNRYQYSPYLLEALLQMVAFYIVMRDADEGRLVIPYEIGEMRFSDKCTHDQVITVEGRLRNRTDEGFSWDARGCDENGRTMMLSRNITMRWFK